MKKYNKLVFIGGARDYHAMDWYRSATHFFSDHRNILLTDLLEGEGYEKLTTDQDKVHNLFIIDKLLISNPSISGNIWRNFVKFILIPVQVFKIRSFAKNYPNAIYTSHGIYYMLLASFAGIPYFGTPQGSEILLRIEGSLFYRIIASRAIKKAKHITVDSISMRDKIKSFFNVEASIIQNGIDLNAIERCKKLMLSKGENLRTKYVSIRGITHLYRITELIQTRNEVYQTFPIGLTLIHPFYEQPCYKELRKILNPKDQDLARLPREKMYELLFQSKVVFSIPKSDSSPRSVYEAIFCGCIVVITYNTYYDVLPNCMKERIVIVDLNQKNWFQHSIEEAEKLLQFDFQPDEVALDLFNQVNSFRRVNELIENYG